MTISLFAASVPVFTQTLTATRACLAKAATQAQAMNVDMAVLLQARLYPNMFPLVRQVQLSTDFAKGAAARLSGAEPPKYEDTETTLAELHQRIDKTIAFLGGFKAAQIDGQEARTIVIKAGQQTLTFTGLDYLIGFALPNFYFHATTAYAILRHNGIEVGKRDFLGLA